MRYIQLIDAVRQKNPTSILEVGTWNGQRALEMLALAPDAAYYGFDLFEEATYETDKEEMNVKPHWYMEKVWDKLQGYDVHLYKGNTRETLKTFNEKVDFVWLDGGHSIETIQSDWDNIKRCLHPDAWVFFDDYYTGAGESVGQWLGGGAARLDLTGDVRPDDLRAVLAGRSPRARSASSSAALPYQGRCMLALRPACASWIAGTAPLSFRKAAMPSRISSRMSAMPVILPSRCNSSPSCCSSGPLPPSSVRASRGANTAGVVGCTATAARIGWQRGMP